MLMIATVQGTTGQTSSQKEVSMAAAPIGLAAAAILRHLHEVITALEAVARQQGLHLTDTQRAHVSARYAARLSAICRADSVNPQDVLKALRHEGKACLLQLVRGSPMAGLRAAEISKAYIFQCLMHQSMNVPLHHQRQLLILDDASQVIEMCSLLPLESGWVFWPCPPTAIKVSCNGRQPGADGISSGLCRCKPQSQDLACKRALVDAQAWWDASVFLYAPIYLYSFTCRLEYLKAFGEQFSDHVSFMTEFPRMRPSDVKKEWVAQAMTVNARMHGLVLRAKDGQMKEVRAAVHILLCTGKSGICEQEGILMSAVTMQVISILLCHFLTNFNLFHGSHACRL
jgi:hypothetical protein